MRLWLLSALILTGCCDKNGYVYVSLIADESDEPVKEPAPAPVEGPVEFTLPALGLPQ